VRRFDLPAKNDNPVYLTISCSECLVLGIEIIQCPVDCQISQHDDLLDAQHHAALRPIYKGREVTGHDTRRRQRLTGVCQQAFGVDVRGDDEHCAGFAGGGYVDHGGFEVKVGGAGVGSAFALRFWGIRCRFGHGEDPVEK